MANQYKHKQKPFSQGTALLLVGLIVIVTALVLLIIFTRSDREDGTANTPYPSTKQTQEDPTIPTPTEDPVKLVSLGIASTMHKNSYFVGDTLDLSGLVLIATYNNGDEILVEEGYTCETTQLNTPGEHWIQVHYETLSTDHLITVSPVVAQSISVNTYPDQTIYYVNDRISLAGLTLTVHYNNGTTEVISSGFDADRRYVESAGAHPVTITYSGLTTSFDVYANTPYLTLSATYDTIEQDCWDSFWLSSKKTPYWKIPLPTAITTPENIAVEWTIASGEAFIHNNAIAAVQPGTIVAVASFTYRDIAYQATYTVEFGIYKIGTDWNGIRTQPSLNGSILTNVPAGVKVIITVIAWDPAVQAADNQFYLWGKTTYDSKTGWIVIS